MAIVLITGGARSGKSRRAEARAQACPGRPVYIATAEALDAEMEERIARHRARRGNDWIERVFWFANHYWVFDCNGYYCCSNVSCSNYNVECRFCEWFNSVWVYYWKYA